MKILAATARVLAVLLLVALPLFAQELAIHTINVGWGSSVFVVGPDGTTVLMEAGIDGRGKLEVVPYLKSIGIKPADGLDYTIVGHQHCDHVGGMDEVVHAGYDVREENYFNGSFYSKDAPPDQCVPQWRTTARDETTAGALRTMQPGTTIDLGNGAVLTCLARRGKIIGGHQVPVEDENDKSLAVLIQYGGFDYLWASDMGGGNIDEDCTGRHTDNQTDVESFVIDAILPTGAHPMISEGGIDVLHVNHHGSESSTNEHYFNHAQPTLAVIATGRGQAANWHLPRKDVVNHVLRAPANTCITAPAAFILQTEEGNPVGSQTSKTGFCVGNIVITTDGQDTFTVNADGDVEVGPNERTAAGLPRTFPLDN
jgi:beta-lactamase superfamily II metal-dependent hydrolase